MRLIQQGSYRDKVMLIGEAPGEVENRIGFPFAGRSGSELELLLGQSGWNRNDLFITNVCHERPPNNEIEAFFVKKSKAKGALLGEGLELATILERLGSEQAALVADRLPLPPVVRGLVQLQKDIDRIRPQLIIVMGNTALWALTGFSGITKWRGSVIEGYGGPVFAHGIKIVVTLHPAALLREPIWRTVVIADLRRAKQELAYPEVRRPQWNFTIPTRANEVEQWLGDHRLLYPSDEPICADVENSIFNGSIHCLGIAASSTEAICIPFAHKSQVGDNVDYWEDIDDEVAVVGWCRRVLTSRPSIFHNCIHDVQILNRSYAIYPTLGHDTMLMQHVLYPGMMGGKIDPITGKVSKKGSSLSLAFCSSLYTDGYIFWKDDGRDWDPAIHSEADFFRYNMTDVVRTYECFLELRRRLLAEDLWEQYLFEMKLFAPVFEMMFRGMTFNNDLRRQYSTEMNSASIAVQSWIERAIGHPLNVESSQQMMQLFYDDLQCEPVLHRKTRQPTLDDKALDTTAKRKPALKPLIARIQARRSIGVYRENFLSVKLSPDGKLRGAFNVAGPETLRFSSNTNAFGEGFNLQNLPRD